MADIAQLGIAVDSSQAERGAISLQRLSGAARMAEQATRGTASGSNAAAQANSAMTGTATAAAGALTRQAGAARQVAQALGMHVKSANDNVRRMGGSMSGLAAQWQDTFITAAMGMQPLMIGLQQGTQVAGQLEAAMQSGSSAVEVLTESFKSLLSPVTLASIALVTLVAAGAQMVDWPAAGAAALRMMADALDAIAPYAAAATAALGLMFAPALLSGAWALVSAITALGTSAIRAAASFTIAWLAALGPAGWFFLALGAATVAIYAFRDELADILGFDIVDKVRTGVNVIIGLFVGGFRAASLIWDKFPDHMDEIGKMAAWHIGVRIREMLRGMIIEINAFMESVSSAFGFESAPIIDQNKAIPEYRPEGGRLVPVHPKPQISGAGQAAYDEVEKVFQSAMEEDWVGAIGEGAEWAGGKLRDLAGLLGEVDEKGKKKRRGKTDADHYQDIVDGADRQIAALLAEQAALGLTEEAAAALRYEQDLLNQAQQKGIELTPQQAAYFKSLAETMAGLEVAVAKAQEAMDFAKGVTRGFLDDFRYGLEQGKGIWESFADAALNALDQIVDKLLGDVLDAMFQVNSAGSGAGGGMFGGLLGGLGKLFGFASGGYTGNGAANRAAGIVHGQEYVFSAPATRRIGVENLERLHTMAKGYQSGGYVQPPPRVQAPANSNPPVYAPVYQIDASGSEAGVEEKIRRALRDHDRQSYGRFLKDWSEANQRGALG